MHNFSHVQIIPDGYGRFTASNGFDTVSAVFVRGTRRTNRVRSHWELLGPDGPSVVYGGKADAVNKAEELLTAPRTFPIPAEDTDRIMREDGVVKGRVRVSLRSAVQTGGAEAMAALLASLLSERPLTDVEYSIIAVSDDGQVMTFQVSGKART